jgi:succinate-acetate transporter protein
MSDEANHQELQEQDAKDRDARVRYVDFAGLALSIVSISLTAFGLLETRTLFVIVAVTASVVGLAEFVAGKQSRR